jgi:hypothetical protein
VARTTLAVQRPSETGTVPTYSAANVDGHTIDPGCVLVVKNGSGGSINVTVQTGHTARGRAVADDVIAVGAGAEKWIALTDEKLLARPSAPDAGKIYVDFSAVTTVTVGAFALP